MEWFSRSLFLGRAKVGVFAVTGRWLWVGGEVILSLQTKLASSTHLIVPNLENKSDLPYFRSLFHSKLIYYESTKPFTFYLLPLVVLAVSLCCLFSCSPDEKPLPYPSGQDLFQLEQKMRNEAKVKLEAYLQRAGRPHSAGDRDATCNCSYEILDGSYATPPENKDAEINFWSTMDCDPLNPAACTYFSAVYFSGNFCGDIIYPGCVEIWQQFPPQQSRFAFECDIPAYSSFDVNLGSVWYGPCTVGDWLSSSITFRVVCVETCNDISFLSYSPSQTLTFTGGVSDHPQEIIQLTGCGCQPILSF